MNKETQPIDRETLLKEANKIIREHEDTLAGIEATGVTQTPVTHQQTRFQSGQALYWLSL